MDPRHLKRIKTVQNLYAYSFNKDTDSLPFKSNKKAVEVIKKIHIIDESIKRYAPKYPLDKIAKTDLAILRLSVYDLLVEKDTPQKVIVNEAVELAKEISSERSYAFVNAVLGQIINTIKDD